LENNIFQVKKMADFVEIFWAYFAPVPPLLNHGQSFAASLEMGQCLRAVVCQEPL